MAPPPATPPLPPVTYFGSELLARRSLAANSVTAVREPASRALCKPAGTGWAHMSERGPPPLRPPVPLDLCPPRGPAPDFTPHRVLQGQGSDRYRLFAKRSCIIAQRELGLRNARMPATSRDLPVTWCF